MDNYIFLMDEGYTYQPNSESDMPDVELTVSFFMDSFDGCKELRYNNIRYISL